MEVLYAGRILAALHTTRIVLTFSTSILPEAKTDSPTPSRETCGR